MMLVVCQIDRLASVYRRSQLNRLSWSWSPGAVQQLPTGRVKCRVYVQRSAFQCSLLTPPDVSRPSFTSQLMSSLPIQHGRIVYVLSTSAGICCDVFFFPFVLYDSLIFFFSVPSRFQLIFMQTLAQ